MDAEAEEAMPKSIYQALVQCFAIIVCGYVAGRLNVVRKSEANGLNTFVGTFSLPSLIFMSLAKLDFSMVNWTFLVAVLAAKSCVFFTVVIICLITTRPSNPGRAALFGIFTTQSNDFAIGYPMIKALYASDHPEYSDYLYLLAPISLVILNPIGFVLLEIGKRRSEEQRLGWQMVRAVIKGVVLNPILVMTILGILGNVIFDHEVPLFVSSILDVFSNAFSASALFLLGLMMVGKVHKLKGVALVIPGILICTKLLVLPIIIRECVNLVNPGSNSTETNDLSTFGFLYGTIPTAPALFIFTLKYNVDIDLIASAMVVCTFLSAPLMFVSAKLISAISAGVNPAIYSKDLRAYSLDVSAISVAVCIWLMLYFLIIEKKRLNSIVHRCTLCLVVAQLAASIGVIIWTKLPSSDVGSALWYTQFILISTGVYSSRLWTAAIALILMIISSNSSYAYPKKLVAWFMFICWGFPLLLVSALCLSMKPRPIQDNDLITPSLQLGRVQTALSILLLIFVFVVTLGCLIMQQRYRKRHASHLISASRSVVDVEDLVAEAGCNSDCEPCISQRTSEPDNTEDAKYQILQHVILLILLCCSMFVGLFLSVGALVMEDMTGIYAMLAFLDVTLCFGQSFIILAIFGLQLRFEQLGCWIRRQWQKCCADTQLELPHEDALSDETREIRDQFKRCHLANCRSSIAVCRRRLLRVYKQVFTGSDFVNWTIETGLANSREQAVQYGKRLLESRVLFHVDGTQHFSDHNFLYSFDA